MTRSTDPLAAVVLAALCAILLGPGVACQPSTPQGGGTAPAGDMTGDADAAAAAGQTLAQAVAADTSTSEAINALVQSLRANPRVVVAVADADGQTAWALFWSGLEYIYEVIDEEGALELPAGQATARTLAHAQPALAEGGNKSLTDSPLGIAQAGMLTYQLPGNNKAALANSLTQTLPLQDARQPVKTMLEACGYVVSVVDADLDFFQNLSQYAVVFIEAHGSRRHEIEAIWDSAAQTFYNSVLGKNLPYCGLNGGEAVLQTTVVPTRELKTQYNEDLECGRLKIRCPVVRRKGQPPATYEFFAVTPNFIRHHDTGTFPQYAFMALSACRSFTADGSPWAQLMYEKSYGSVVVGWDYSVKYGTSTRAMLHLFQFLAGANQQFDITEINPATGAKTIYPLLFKNDAPVLPQTVNQAMSALAAKSFDYDTKTTARLTGSGDTLYGDTQLVLAPAIETFETLGDGKASLTGRCQDNAELQFSSGAAVNIGAASNGTWTFSLPGSYSGPMSLHLQDRCCPPRDLLSWNALAVTVRPVSTSTALGTCDFEMTYHLAARAVAAGERSGSSVWDAPDFAFRAAWDPDRSQASWSVSGNASDPDPMFPSSCTWSGGNTKAFNSVSVSAGSTGGLDSYDGKTAYLTVEPPFDLDYQMTCSGLFAPTYACGVYGSINVTVDLGADWSIRPGSTTDLMGLYTIEWQPCTPDPTFVSSLLPR